MELGKFGGAVKDFKTVIALNPQCPDGFCDRGRVETIFGETSDALADFNRAIAANPKFAPAYIGRAHLWINKRDWEHAKSDLDRAITLGPKNSWLYSVRSEVRFHLGYYSGSSEDSHRVSALAKEEPIEDPGDAFTR
jgi:tetratricopeptide (TPR) repeat protein